jgi:S1-C subfamily serine protease
VRNVLTTVPFALIEIFFALFLGIPHILFHLPMSALLQQRVATIRSAMRLVRYARELQQGWSCTHTKCEIRKRTVMLNSILWRSFIPIPQHRSYHIVCTSSNVPTDATVLSAPSEPVAPAEVLPDDIEEPDESRKEAQHAHEPGHVPGQEAGAEVGMQGLDLAAVAAEVAPSAPPPFTPAELEALVADLKEFLAAQPQPEPAASAAASPIPPLTPSPPADASAPPSSASPGTASNSPKASHPVRPFLASWSVKEVCSWYLQVEEQLHPAASAPTSSSENAPVVPTLLPLLVKHRIDGAKLLAFTSEVSLIPLVPPALLSRILYLRGLDASSQLFHGEPRPPGSSTGVDGEEDDSQHADPNMRHLRSILQSTVKIFCTSTSPDFARPWSRSDQIDSSSSGFVISGKRILCNAHGVTDNSSLRVRRHGDARKYKASVLAISHESDLALLSVEDASFWVGMKALKFGPVPRLQEQVIVVGYPSGGDSICVTKGVVSRIMVSNYVHSDESLLTVQIDAAINSGNSGGPVLLNGVVVGVAFQGVSSLQSVGFIIPTPVVHHFLTDLLLHGRYTGFPSFHGLTFQKLENEGLKRYLGLGGSNAPTLLPASSTVAGEPSASSSAAPSTADASAASAISVPSSSPSSPLSSTPAVPASETGVVLMHVAPLDDPLKVLRAGDVVTHLDGIAVADDGSIFFRAGERVSARYIPSSKFVGDMIRIRLIRDGQAREVSFELRPRRQLVATTLYDQGASYFILAGLVFTPLSRPYLHDTFGKSWSKRAPVDLIAKTYYGTLEFPDQQVVLLSNILVDDSNAGYGASFHNIELVSLNGVRVKNLKHLVELVEGERKGQTWRNEEAAPFKDFVF